MGAWIMGVSRNSSDTKSEGTAAVLSGAESFTDSSQQGLCGQSLSHRPRSHGILMQGRDTVRFILNKALQEGWGQLREVSTLGDTVDASPEAGACLR